MSERPRVLRAAIAMTAVLLVASARAFPRPLSQDDKTCLACHGDPEAKSESGEDISVSGAAYASSVHGRAGIKCVGCHSVLRGVEDFPHAAGLAAVKCADCHAKYARATAGGVHGTWSPRLAASPVRCADCHGRHDIRPSSDPDSRLSSANRPAACGRCHPGAGPNFSRGRVHELAGPAPLTPAGVIRVLYKALIAVMGAFFLAYIAADLVRRRRPR